MRLAEPSGKNSEFTPKPLICQGFVKDRSVHLWSRILTNGHAEWHTVPFKFGSTGTSAFGGVYVAKNRHEELRPRNGRTLVVGIVARISGGPNQKELSLEDQVDHAKEVVADLFKGPVEYITIATTGKGERLDRPELIEVERLLRSQRLDLAGAAGSQRTSSSGGVRIRPCSARPSARFGPAVHQGPVSDARADRASTCTSGSPTPTTWARPRTA